jgi:hypothetical protein
MAENKPGNRGIFFEPQKPPSTKPSFTMNPPQIHHQNTTINHPFSPKPPAKTPNPTSRKKTAQF